MKKQGSQADDPRQKLVTELKGLIKEIDQEGLLFLIKQANTLIYNQRIEKLNREAEEARVDQPRADTAAGGAEKQEVVERDGIRVERGSFGRSFILDIGGMRKTFAEAELLGLVRAGRAAEEPGDGAARLYRWLKRNRDDVLLDTGIQGPKNSLLAALWSVLGSTFAVREE